MKLYIFPLSGRVLGITALKNYLVPTIAEVRVMWFTKIENHIRHLPVLSPVALQ
jgi:hypothetical protein